MSSTLSVIQTTAYPLNLTSPSTNFLFEDDSWMYSTTWIDVLSLFLHVVLMSIVIALCAFIRFVMNRMQLLPIEHFHLSLALGETALGVLVLLVHTALRIQALVAACVANVTSSHIG